VGTSSVDSSIVPKSKIEDVMASELSPVPDDLGFEPTLRGLETTQRVFGRYVLRRVLGRGGMGIVWLGHDERLDREVALKFLPDAINFDPSALDDLKRETRRCLELTHPNIIRIYDFAKDEQAAAISMEYIDGQTLAALRIGKPSRVFEAVEIRNWMIKACQALHYAHEEVGVVHRDLKPANFMVTSRGQMKLADFGIAQNVCDSMSRLTMRRSSSGTLAYMSPQQLNGDMAKPSDDVYALGATIYELLTGKPPFHSGDIPFQVRLSMPRSMTEKRQELEVTGEPIPAAWEEAIAACLSKVPEERPATMADLAERLRLASPTRRLPSLPVRPPALVPDNIAQTQKRLIPPAAPMRAISKTTWIVAGGAAVLTLAAIVAVVLPHHRPDEISSVAVSPVIPSDSTTTAETLKPIIEIAPTLRPAAPETPVAVKPAEIDVTSEPEGALVHIDGQADQHTPAAFHALSPGAYQMAVSANGYEPVQRTITATAGARIDLGSIPLVQLAGNLNVNTVPDHVNYVLTGTGNIHNVEKEGTTPEFFTALPTGTYQITLTKSGFPTYDGTIQIRNHATEILTADLTELSLAASASPNTAQVIRGQMDIGQLNTQERAELAELESRAFTAYLNGNLLAYAHGELRKLKLLGGDTTSQETQLSTRELAAETQIASQLRTLILHRKLASASQLFATLDGSFEKDSMDRLNAEFQAPLAQYQQQVDSAISQSKSAPPEMGYLQIKTLIAQYPSDLNLQLALASIAEHAAPDHARLTDLQQVFHAFARENKDVACQPVFAVTQVAVADELQQLDVVTGALTAAKEGTPEQKRQLATLETRKETYENRRIGSPDKNNPFAATVNFFGKAVTGHPVVDNHPYFKTRGQKREAIEDVQSQIDDLKASMIQTPDVVDQAQKNYDAFVARFPWGQTG
jgi:serine/threonine protein kinase